MELIDYINICYEVAHNSRNFPSNCVKLSLCCAHTTKTILDRYMPLYPLCSSIITKKKVSNALIEQWFGFLKHSLFQNQKKFRPTAFVKRVRRHVLKVFDEIELNISKHRLERVTLPNKIKNGKLFQNEIDCEESWNRKPKPAFSYFTGKYFKYL